MELILKDLTSLLSGLIDGTIRVTDDDSHRFTINALCEALSDDVTPSDFRGGSGAGDVDEWLCEIELGDWYELLTYQFDDAEITDYLREVSSLGRVYSNDELMGFVNGYFSSSSENARTFILRKAQALSGS